MVNGLKVAKQLKLHQALHGYADGHHELALSRTLKPRDQKILLELSDISGPGGNIGPEGYLTGYPLPESGLFALGRTWPALEMPRPGCVWTHTLLIDFTDLAELVTLTCLLDVFRRPAGANAGPEYIEPASFEPDAQTFVPTLSEGWARQVIAALYEKPERRIVAEHFGNGVDRTVLALWSQQWPRLRRSFRFCTFAVSDRSTKNSNFDLQIVPRFDRSVHTRFEDAVNAETFGHSFDRWLDDAVQDLLHPNGFGLRDSLRGLGADIAMGRGAFRPLCRLHRSLTGGNRQPEAFRNAISILKNELGAKQARTAWETVAKAAFEQLESLDEPSFCFLWENLSLVDTDTLIFDAEQLGKLAWQRDPGMLVHVLDDKGPFQIVIERTLRALDAAELVSGLARAPALRQAALARRPEIVGQPAFWKSLDCVEEVLHASKRGHEGSATLAAMLARRDDLASEVVKAFGSRLVLQVLRASWDILGEARKPWLHPSICDTAAVAEFLSTEPNIPKTMLYGLARTLPPDAVPNEYGEDPWLISHRHAVGKLGDSAASYMAAYLLSRALGQRSRCPGELAQLTFESTHTAAASNRLTEDGWRLFKSRLPKTTPWLRWNRCHQLRVGVADLFINCELAPSIFVELCKDDQLFSLLLHRATKRKRGRTYLELVRRYIVQKGDSRLAARGRMIKKLLR